MPSKLLLADDSVTIQRVIELTFEDEDIEVTTVGDGQQAIDRLERDRPDIVLVDATMPERDGYEVAAYIKSTPALADIPVLLLTGAFEPVDEARARAARVDGVLSKPFETDTVIKRVRELLLGRRATRESSREADHFGPAGSLSPFEEFPPLSAPPPTAGQGPSASGSLDDEFFDRLDQAFGPPGVTGAEGTQAAARAVEPAVEAIRGAGISWADGASRAGAQAEDPLAWDLPPTDVRSPSPAGWPTPPVPERALAPAGPAPSAPVAPGGPPPLADAFAALLEAEQAQASRAAVAATPAPSADDTVGPIVERVARRVLEQLDDQAVREAVMQHVSGIAERLVRQELDRIKAGH